MIIVIVNEEFNYENGKYEKMISYGYDTDNDRKITLPCVDISLCDWVIFDKDINEYIIKES